MSQETYVLRNPKDNSVVADKWTRRRKRICGRRSEICRRGFQWTVEHILRHAENYLLLQADRIARGSPWGNPHPQLSYERKSRFSYSDPGEELHQKVPCVLLRYSQKFCNTVLGLAIFT